MNIWPWSRFAKYEEETEALYVRLNAEELIAFEAEEKVRELEKQIETSNLARKQITARSIDLSNRLMQTTADYNVMRARFLHLEAEINSKVRPSIVLQPPTKHVQRDSKNSANNHEGVGSHEPLEGLTSPWPFPTANMYEEY